MLVFVRRKDRGSGYGDGMKALRLALGGEQRAVAPIENPINDSRNRLTPSSARTTRGKSSVSTVSRSSPDARA